MVKSPSKGSQGTPARKLAGVSFFGILEKNDDQK
jgi:hypothetical protein